MYQKVSKWGDEINIKKFNSHELSKLIIKHIEKFIDEEVYSISKVRLGIEIMLINISKFIVLFITAYLLNVLVPTIIVLIGFAFIRRTGGGIHAKTSFRCTVFSVGGLVLGAIVALRLNLNIWVYLLALIVFNVIIYKYAPRDTEKNPIKDSKKRIRLRNITLRNMNLLALASLLFDKKVISLIFIGFLLAIITILPMNKKIHRLK